MVFTERMDAKLLFLTPNADTIHVMGWLDLSEGPVVIESPPEFLGIVQDAWFHWVTDMGSPGPDRGLGGTYLIVPPATRANGPKAAASSPTQPEGVGRGNWIQTVPEKGWFVGLRLYSPLDSFFDKSWRISEIERVQ